MRVRLLSKFIDALHHIYSDRFSSMQNVVGGFTSLHYVAKVTNKLTTVDQEMVPHFHLV